MNISYEGIGQWAATFLCDGAEVGEVVKMSDQGTVSPCDAEDDFAGVVIAKSRDEAACTVALGGMATVTYSGESAPEVGRNALVADGNGGVTVDEDGREYLAVEVDTSAKTVTIVL
ncbi:MAG: hypothetical protein IKN53_06535 [Oscillibacter sp.]|nr:hypothetical protein [Oscillibacter sp.]